GIALPAEQQKRYGDLKMRLSELQSRFSNQLMDATQAWTRHVTDVSELAGLPESALAQARQAAEARDLDGWLITLEFPSYYAVMTYADNADLRREVYTAYCTRASDQGPHAGQNDNGPVVAGLRQVRRELPRRLRYATYAGLRRGRQRADSTAQRLGFRRDVAGRSRPCAEADLQALREFAASRGCSGLQSWDTGYYAGQL